MPPERTQDQPATAGTKRKVSRCHEAGLNIVFEGCSPEEVGRKRVRLSPCSPASMGSLANLQTRQ